MRTQDLSRGELAEKVSLAKSVLSEEDLFIKHKKLQRHLEFLELQEEYIKDEQKNLKRELLRAQEEVKRIQSVPLVIGQFLEPIDQHTGIVGSTTGSNYVVRILSTIDRELLKPSSSVALYRHSNSLVDVLPPEADSSISMWVLSALSNCCMLTGYATYAGSARTNAQMSSTATLEVSTSRSKRSEKQSSYPLYNSTSTARSVSILHGVVCSMDHQEQARRCS